MKSHIKIKMESETPLMTTEGNSPGQVWSTARNSPGQKPPSWLLKEIPPDKSGLRQEIPLDRNPHHDQWKKLPRTSLVYSEKFPWTTARTPPPAHEKSFLQQENPLDYSENPPTSLWKKFPASQFLLAKISLRKFNKGGWNFKFCISVGISTHSTFWGSKALNQG